MMSAEREGAAQKNRTDKQVKRESILRIFFINLQRESTKETMAAVKA